MCLDRRGAGNAERTSYFKSGSAFLSGSKSRDGSKQWYRDMQYRLRVSGVSDLAGLTVQLVVRTGMPMPDGVRAQRHDGQSQRYAQEAYSDLLPHHNPNSSPDRHASKDAFQAASVASPFVTILSLNVPGPGIVLLQWPSG